MTDRSILFSGPMVRAQLEGRKTKTRRLLKPQPYIDKMGNFCVPGRNGEAHYNFGQRMNGTPITEDFVRWHVRFAIGDRLWVREAWRVSKRWDETAPNELPVRGCTVFYEAGGSASNDTGGWTQDSWPLTSASLPEWAGRYRNPLHMPRWASRLTLTVTDVQVQRLQEISPADAIAEGIGKVMVPVAARTGSIGAIGRWGVWGSDAPPADTPQDAYRDLWDSINAARAPWAANPWVVAVSFDVARSNIDEKEADRG